MPTASKKIQNVEIWHQKSRSGSPEFCWFLQQHCKLNYLFLTQVNLWIQRSLPYVRSY